MLPISSEWVNRLRNQGYPAFLSGAGPTVLVLSTEPVEEALLQEARDRGIRVEELTVAGPVTVEDA